MVRRFTTADRWFSSLLGPTFPNRQYLHAAQSARQKHDPGPLTPGMFHTKTIWDNLRRRRGAVGVLLHRPPHRCRCGANASTTSRTRSNDYFDDASNGEARRTW